MSSELQSQEKPKYTLAGLLASDVFKRKLSATLGSPENVERFVQVGLQALKRNTRLPECSQATVFDCLLKLSQLGLEPDGYHAHLIPFNNKVKYLDEQGKEREKWELQCQLIVDYKGLINVIRRNPKVAVLKGGVIYAMDQFTFEEGSSRVFAHRRVYPKPGEELKNNPIALVYAFIKWTNGDWDVDIMTVDEVERIRARSRAKDFGPWVTDWAEMAMKTAIRHLSKRLELSFEERSIITADDDQFGYANPFDSQPAPKLTYTKPEFLNAPSETTSDFNQSSSDRDQQGITRGSATQASAASTDAQSKTDGRRTRKSSDQRGKAEKQEEAGTGKTEPETAAAKDERPEQQASPVAERDKGEGEKTYQFGPGDEASSTSSDDQQPVDSSTAKREGERVDEDSATGAGTESAAPQQDANAEERQKANQNLAKLIKNIQKDKVAEEKVISVLMSFDRDTGFAADSGKVSDLPDEAIDICVRNWGSILFNIKKGQSE